MSSADDLDEREPPSPSDCGNVVSVPENSPKDVFVVEFVFFSLMLSRKVQCCGYQQCSFSVQCIFHLMLEVEK